MNFQTKVSCYSFLESISNVKIATQVLQFAVQIKAF